MPLENATHIAGLVAANPTGSDPRSQGDDHLRLIKSALTATFPNANRAFRLADNKAAVFTDTPTVLGNSHEGKTVFAARVGSAEQVIRLPSDPADGFQIRIRRVRAAGTVSIEATGGKTISTLGVNLDSGDIKLIRQGETAELVYNASGTSWDVISLTSGVTATTQTITQSGGNLTWDVAAASNAEVTLSNNVTALTVNNTEDGRTYNLVIKQPSAGGLTFAFPSAWQGPSNPGVIADGANEHTLLAIRVFGTTVYAVLKRFE